MKAISSFFIFLFLFSMPVMMAQSFDFESSVLPARVTDAASGSVSQSALRWKDGSKSLLWQWKKPAARLLIDEAVPFDMNNFRQGAIFWIYNETPVADVLKCRFVDAQQVVQYQFDFHLNFSGWRIARLGSIAMTGPKQVRTGLKLELQAPASLQSGHLFIDRMSFATDVDYRTANDAQIPVVMQSDWLSHWSKLYTWSQLPAGGARPQSLTAAQQQTLKDLRTALDAVFTKSSSQISSANNFFQNAAIREEAGVLSGRPFVTYDDRNRATGSDMSFEEYGSMVSGFAQDYLFNGNDVARERFLLAVRFGLDQGFAYGSSMGNNSHYGYYSRSIFPAFYAMRDVLRQQGLLTEASRALIYWSGLYEARKRFEYTRGGIVDCWNTLLAARIYAAAMIENDVDSYGELQDLVAWTDASLLPTAGTAGGMKWDGTVFHHAGHYPAYAVGGFNGLGFFFRIMNECGFRVSENARLSLRRALLAMTTYSNRTDWTIGFSGRHPHSGGITAATVTAMGHVALHGGIDDPAMPADTLLGNAYLRLQPADSEISRRLIAAGCTPASDPQGFTVYNHHAAGVYRLGSAMATVKGYNEQVWSSEIYTSNNRYGRYQGYGALELLTAGSPVSRVQSGFSEPGWDWNCLPGTTTIMLPNDLLNSPQSGSLLAKSTNKFAGASALGKNGIFGMKLSEISGTNFTPSHKARKSVFFFGDKLICLGSDIVNTNKNYPTTTTLFQNAISDPSMQLVDVDGNRLPAMGMNLNEASAAPRWLGDLTGNYYRIQGGLQVVLTGKKQTSNHNQTKATTTGNFLLARLDHGTAPAGRGYEYMVVLMPDAARLDQLKHSSPGYVVLQRDKIAHIVRDEESGSLGYVVFDNWQSSTDPLVRRITAETLVMARRESTGRLSLSVCAPDLNFGEAKAGSQETFNHSRESIKTVVLKGHWQLPEEAEDNGEIEFSYSSDETTLKVSCSLGLPLEISLVDPTDTSVGALPALPEPVVRVNGNILTIEGVTKEVWLTTTDGRLLVHETGESESRTIRLSAGQSPFLLIMSDGSGRKIKQMIF